MSTIRKIIIDLLQGDLMLLHTRAGTYRKGTLRGTCFKHPIRYVKKGKENESFIYKLLQSFLASDLLLRVTQ